MCSHRSAFTPFLYISPNIFENLETLRPSIAMSFYARRTQMDLVYMTGIGLFYFMLVGLAYGCAKLGGAQ